MEQNRPGIKVEYRRSSRRRGELAYCLSAKVTRASGIPAEVFVFHRDTRMLATGYPFDYRAGAEFQNVATPVDIEETPPESEAGPNARFFRSDHVELFFRSDIDMDRAKSAIDDDVSALVLSWGSLNDSNGFEDVETRVHGVIPEHDSNDSNDSNDVDDSNGDEP